MRILVTLLALTAFVAAQDLSAIAKKRQQMMIARFYKHVDTLKDVDAATKAKVLKFKESGLLGGEYGCINQSLLAIYPDYKRADAMLMNERLVAATHAYDKLRGSEDPYLRTYATFRYGLTVMQRERFKEAEEVFRKVLNEHRRYAGCDVEAYFYRIICLGQERKKEEALAAIEAFEKDVPEAPERYKKAVEQIKNELMQEWESPLYELAGMMGHAGREIERGETGKPTQKEQDEIVAIIEELIRKQEEKEGQGKGKGGGSGPPRGNQQSSNPANRSQAPPGASRVGDLRPKPKRKPGEQWGLMRDKERDEVLQALKEKFPDRYRELLEQYHKALAEGKRVTTPSEDE